jgi:hypothetical protein
MNHRWNGYLVRALNEFASLTAACIGMNASDRIPIPAKASTRDRNEHRRNQAKSSATSRTRKYKRSC